MTALDVLVETATAYAHAYSALKNYRGPQSRNKETLRAIERAAMTQLQEAARVYAAEAIREGGR